MFGGDRELGGWVIRLLSFLFALMFESLLVAAAAVAVVGISVLFVRPFRVTSTREPHLM